MRVGGGRECNTARLRGKSQARESWAGENPKRPNEEEPPKKLRASQGNRESEEAEPIAGVKKRK